MPLEERIQERRKAPPRRLLIVEDESDISNALRLVLGHSRISIALAVNGREALDFARAIRPDVMILDLMLPFLDGFEVFQALRREPELTPTRIIFLSAHSSASAFAHAAKLGAHACFRKPFDASLLRATVLAAMGLKEDPRDGSQAALMPNETGEAEERDGGGVGLDDLGLPPVEMSPA